MNAKKMLASACVALTLGGCGGGGGGAVTRSAFDEKVEVLQAEAERLRGMKDTRPGELPTTGSARYRGTAGFVQDKDGVNADSYIGDLSLTANFGTKRVGGRIDNFAAESGADVQGALAIDGAPIVGTGFKTGIHGTLTSDGTRIAVRAKAEGGFLGPSADSVAGLFHGLIGRDQELLHLTSGVFIGER